MGAKKVKRKGNFFSTYKKLVKVKDMYAFARRLPINNANNNLHREQSKEWAKSEGQKQMELIKKRKDEDEKKEKPILQTKCVVMFVEI